MRRRVRWRKAEKYQKRTSHHTFPNNSQISTRTHRSERSKFYSNSTPPTTPSPSPLLTVSLKPFIYFPVSLRNVLIPFIQSLYRNGKLDRRGSRHANKVMFHTKHLSTVHAHLRSSDTVLTKKKLRAHRHPLFFSFLFFFNRIIRIFQEH